jgi:hypothetical protein
MRINKFDLILSRFINKEFFKYLVCIWFVFGLYFKRAIHKLKLNRFVPDFKLCIKHVFQNDWLK